MTRREARTTTPPDAQQRVHTTLADLSHDHQVALSDRISALIDVLAPSTEDGPVLSAGTTQGDLHDHMARLAASVHPDDRSTVWLVLAALSLRLPNERQVIAASRSGVLDGPYATIDEALRLLVRSERPDDLRIARDEYVVDIHNTARMDFFTGIQRVARECARGWARRHEITLVSWTADLACPVEISPATRARILSDEHTLAARPTDPAGAQERVTRVIPWASTYLIPELAAERPRTERLLAMARQTQTSVNAIGFDVVPLTTSETVIVGLPSEFAGHLAAARHYDRIGAISAAAAQEYRGWRGMLAGAGYAGPDIHDVTLAAEVAEPQAHHLARTRERLMISDLPMVLCVGSHEPRKNHLAVLHAAEVLWREGREFSLTFVGGNSWNSEHFHREVATLQGRNRAVETVAGIDDEMLWAAYRLARFTVFPSFNEGFGLPVAESIASGTPVITSKFGSMAEIADDGGAVLIDPHDDHALVAAMESLFDDSELYTSLCAEASARGVRTWDEYTDELWDYLVDGVQRV